MNASIEADVFAAICAPVPAQEFIDLLYQTGFSAETYRDRYDDFLPLNWGPTSALTHFFNYGIAERRVVPMTLDRVALTVFASLPIVDFSFKARLLTNLAHHFFTDLDHPCGPAILERWPLVHDLAQKGARPYFIAGDSHSHQFNLAGARAGEWLLPIHLLCTAGSAAGLANPTSHARFGLLLAEAIKIIHTLPDAGEMPFLFQFGQVDIEFVYHFRRVRDSKQVLDLQDYQLFCDETIRRYIHFLTDVFELPRRQRVFLVSVFPPALSDAAWQQGYVNGDIARRESDNSEQALSAGIRELQIADLRQRTEIHLYFNAALKVATEQNGFRFIDAATPFLAPDGLLDPCYMVPEAQGAEHHLDSRQTYPGVVDLIWRCLDTTTLKSSPETIIT